MKIAIAYTTPVYVEVDTETRQVTKVTVSDDSLTDTDPHEYLIVGRYGEYESYAPKEGLPSLPEIRETADDILASADGWPAWVVGF